MKKLLFLFAALAMSVGVFAQNMRGTVYLKNGSIIHGTIVELVPEKSVKILTRDGNIFAYTMSEVEKITNERVQTSTPDPNRGGYSKWNGPETGYRGFVDLNWTVGIGESAGADYIGVLTSHGYQICPYIYTGLGIGVNYFYNGSAVNIPIFADIRSDILEDRAVTPFVDLKIGYSVLDAEGLYLSPSIGCRIKAKRGLAFNIGVGYTLQKYKFEIFDGYDYYGGNLNLDGISIRFGVEF